jgi:fatty acid desaturase
MTTLQRQEQNPVAHLSDDDIENLGRELDAIRQQVLDSRGERDAVYIRNVIDFQRKLELASRAVLLFSLFPPAWLAGTVGLSVAKIVENMEIGHNVMHGQWDWMRDNKIHSTTWEWDNASPSDMWKHSHNEIHHTYTNVVGKDEDLGYGIMRVDEDQRWMSFYLAQPLWNLINACFFQYGIAAYDLKIGKYLKGKTDKEEFRRQSKNVLEKIRRQVTKDYVLHPLLSGPSAVTTLTANLTANLVRNLWTHSVIMCGHFPEGVQTYEKKSIDGETRGEWYLRHRTSPVPGSAKQSLPGDRAEGARPVRALRPDLRQRPDGQAGRLGVEEGVPALASQRCPAQGGGGQPGERYSARLPLRTGRTPHQRGLAVNPLSRQPWWPPVALPLRYDVPGRDAGPDVAAG